MALYFSTANGREPQELHVGDKARLDMMRLNAPDVVEVQADGDELEHIRREFRNLPGRSARVVRYYGDHAKFIAGNF